MRIIVISIAVVTALFVACGTQSQETQWASWGYSLDDDNQGMVGVDVPKDWSWNNVGGIIGPAPDVGSVYMQENSNDEVVYATIDYLPMSKLNIDPSSVNLPNFHEKFKTQVANENTILHDAKYKSGLTDGKTSTFVSGIYKHRVDISFNVQKAYVINGLYIWEFNCLSLLDDEEGKDTCGRIVNSARFSG